VLTASGKCENRHLCFCVSTNDDLATASASHYANINNITPDDTTADVLPPLQNAQHRTNPLEMCNILKAVITREATGPDRIPGWLLQEHADILVEPLAAL